MVILYHVIPWYFLNFFLLRFGIINYYFSPSDQHLSNLIRRKTILIKQQISVTASFDYFYWISVFFSLWKDSYSIERVWNTHILSVGILWILTYTYLCNFDNTFIELYICYIFDYIFISYESYLWMLFYSRFLWKNNYHQCVVEGV